MILKSMELKSNFKSNRHLEELYINSLNRRIFQVVFGLLKHIIETEVVRLQNSDFLQLLTK
jgi:predicted ATPase